MLNVQLLRRSQHLLLAATLGLTATASAVAQPTGVWQMNSGEVFVLIEDQSVVTGVFTGNYFGAAAVLGQESSAGIQLSGFSLRGTYDIHLDVAAGAQTLTGSATRHGFNGSKTTLTFSANRPWVFNGFGEYDGVWDLTGTQSPQETQLWLFTLEENGVPTHFGLELIMQSGTPIGIKDIYRGKVITGSPGLLIRGNLNLMFGVFDGDDLGAGRYSFPFGLSELSGRRIAGPAN